MQEENSSSDPLWRKEQRFISVFLIEDAAGGRRPSHVTEPLCDRAGSNLITKRGLSNHVRTPLPEVKWSGGCCCFNTDFRQFIHQINRTGDEFLEYTHSVCMHNPNEVCSESSPLVGICSLSQFTCTKSEN